MGWKNADFGLRIISETSLHFSRSCSTPPEQFIEQPEIKAQLSKAHAAALLIGLLAAVVAGELARSAGGWRADRA